jgi:alpha-tubulin suppressor-like RCC1 family protein
VERDGDAAHGAAPGGTGGKTEGYWAGRLGARATPDSAWPPVPPSPPDDPARSGVVTTGAEASTEAAPPPLLPPGAPPATARRAPWPGSHRGATYGPYRAHNPVKNWIIGGVAVLVLVAATVSSAVLLSSGVRHSLASLTALPSSGSNTVAWYWPLTLFASNGAQPLNVTDDFGFTTIATSDEDDSVPYFVGLDRHGAAWVWGADAGPRAGLPVTAEPTAATMPSGVLFTDISTNDGYILALDQSGHLWSWGDADGFFLTTTTAPSGEQRPVEVPAPGNVTFKAISVGSNVALAVDSSGHLWSWGVNDEQGDLGLGTTAVVVANPTEVATPPGVFFTAVSAGIGQSVALDSSGRAWTWGDGQGGDLGVSTAAVPSGPGSCEATGAFCTFSPLQVSIPAGVRLTAVAAGDGYDAALDSTGRIWTWGSNNNGALGLGETGSTCTSSCVTEPGERPTATSSVPAAVVTPPGIHFVTVAVMQSTDLSGQDDTVALDGEGHAWAWGANIYLQLTSGTSPCLSSTGHPQARQPGVELCVMKPTALPMPSGVSFKGVAATTSAVFGFPADAR